MRRGNEHRAVMVLGLGSWVFVLSSLNFEFCTLPFQFDEKTN
jgi:hypothetical protein